MLITIDFLDQWPYWPCWLLLPSLHNVYCLFVLQSHSVYDFVDEATTLPTQTYSTKKRAKPSTHRIGFIGLGTVGMSLARNLLKHSHRLCVWNRTASKVSLRLGTPSSYSNCFANLTDATINKYYVIVYDTACLRLVYESRYELGGLFPKSQHLVH